MHGKLSLLKDLVRAHRFIAEDGDADAARAVTFVAIEHVGLTEGGADLLSDNLGLGGSRLGNFAQVVEYHRKIISAASRHGVCSANAGGQAPGRFLKQEVAGLMSERVVELLEFVKVNEQQRSLVGVCTARVRPMLQPLQKQAAVGQAGQRITE
jgi:hypothetical protein